eukprot:3020370-Lingulodinium_polyedra.AAC.1
MPRAVAAIAVICLLPDSIYGEFCQAARSFDAFELFGVGCHFRQLVAQAHEASWFTVQGAEQP